MGIAPTPLTMSLQSPHVHAWVWLPNPALVSENPWQVFVEELAAAAAALAGHYDLQSPGQSLDDIQRLLLLETQF